MLINIFGKRGSGKTTLIKGDLDNFPGPVAVIDILGNYESLKDSQNEPLYPSTGSITKFIDWLKEYSELSDDEKSEYDKVFVLTPQDPDVALDYVSAVLWELKGGTLVLDEADGFSITNAPVFDWIIRYGRNRSVHLVTGCRRPAELSRNITAGANRLFVLRTQEPRDVKYFEETLLGERAQTLMELPEFHGLLLDYDRGKLSKFNFNEAGQIHFLESEPLNKTLPRKGESE